MKIETMRALSFVAVFVSGCFPGPYPAASSRDATRRPAEAEALSRALEPTVTPDMTEELTRSFDLGYSTGSADGTAMRLKEVLGRRHLACINTDNEIMGDARSAEDIHDIAQDVLGCSKWDEKFATMELPSPERGRSRLLVARRMASYRPEIYVRAFDFGYEAGINDEAPAQGEAAKAAHETCIMGAERWESIFKKRSADAVCLAVEAKMYK